MAEAKGASSTQSPPFPSRNAPQVSSLQQMGEKLPEDGWGRPQPLIPPPNRTSPKEGLALGWGELNPDGEVATCGMWGQQAWGLGCVDTFPGHRSRRDEIHEIYENCRAWSPFFRGQRVFLKVTKAPAWAGVGWTKHRSS